jgi:hypothetical protein
VEAPKEDPTSFRRYAEKIQAHLLNFSCIDESVHADIIEYLTKKLHIQYRLSWNGGRRGGLDRQTINGFGVYLCARASAYQNAYFIAVNQYQKANNSLWQPRQHLQDPRKRNVQNCKRIMMLDLLHRNKANLKQTEGLKTCLLNANSLTAFTLVRSSKLSR